MALWSHDTSVRLEGNLDGCCDNLTKQNVPTQLDQYPLLMENPNGQHVIYVRRNNDASSSASRDDLYPEVVDGTEHEDGLSSNRESTDQSTSDSSIMLNPSNSSFVRRADLHNQRRRSPLDSGLWISIELIVTLGQIIAAVVVLSLSRHEKPHAPLFAWVVGYTSGCFATLPLLYWRFRNRNQGTEQDSNQSHVEFSQNTRSEPAPYTAISDTHTIDEENQQAAETTSQRNQYAGSLGSRLNGLGDNFKMVLDCFFAVWFVVGNIWIFGGHVSPSDAPKLYRLCIVFLTFSCVGYAMPFILCATICCCLPCIISVLGFREDFSQTRGASLESINALPTYMFNTKQLSNIEPDNLGGSEGGTLAAGTEKERFVSGEDAICCICLAKYGDNEELKELPCYHIFHVECIDKWLKINASCPLCKCEIGEGGVGVGSSSSRDRESLDN